MSRNDFLKCSKKERFGDLNTYLENLEKNDKLTDNVYHYTDTYDNLINILKSRRLLMKDFTRLDEEIVYSLDFLQKRIPDRTLKFKYNENIPTTFWKSFKWYRSRLRVFLASFSLKRDDPILWRG